MVQLEVTDLGIGWCRYWLVQVLVGVDVAICKCMYGYVLVWMQEEVIKGTTVVGIGR